MIYVNNKFTLFQLILNMIKKVKLCSKCVININSTYVNSVENKCSYCSKFEKYYDNLIWRLKNKEGSFTEKINERKWRWDYDCLVMVSWWKDSIMTLYKIVQETDLRPLAYTFDNWFESQEALSNIQNAVDVLEVDWILDKPWYMKKIIISILKDKVPISICRFCSPLMLNRAIKLAWINKIPYLITGWNKGQSDKEPSRFLLRKISSKSLDKLIWKYHFMKNIWLHEYENLNLLENNSIEILSPWVFEKRNTEKYMKIINNKLWWKTPKQSYPKKSTNCTLNFLQVVLSRKYFGYTHYDCEESSLINYWEKTKNESIDLLDMDIDTNIINDILKKLNLSLEDIWLTKRELLKYSTFL